MSVCNIFQIQHFSVNDGDGIRSTVFFKGCKLRCRWCANPESWSFEPQLMYLPHKCVHCGACVQHCAHHANALQQGKLSFASASCVLCGICLQYCPAGARQVMGKSMLAADVMAEIEKDVIFYTQSGGGVTFSGGEPYLHPRYLRTLAGRCHELGISTCTESCGYFDFAECEDIIAEMDELFFDIKLMNSVKHKRFTGQDNALILENICKASAINDNIIIRIPLISGVNDDDANITATCDFLRRRTHIRKLELLPYHKLGVDKMTALGIPAAIFRAPSQERQEKLAQLIEANGIEIVSFK